MTPENAKKISDIYSYRCIFTSDLKYLQSASGIKISCIDSHGNVVKSIRLDDVHEFISEALNEAYKKKIAEIDKELEEF